MFIFHWCIHLMWHFYIIVIYFSFFVRFIYVVFVIYMKLRDDKYLILLQKCSVVLYTFIRNNYHTSVIHGSLHHFHKDKITLNSSILSTYLQRRLTGFFITFFLYISLLITFIQRRKREGGGEDRSCYIMRMLI